MATLVTTPIKTFISGETVTPAKLNELGQSTVALTAGTIVDADISASAAIAASKLAGTLDLSSKTITLPDSNIGTSKIANAAVTAAKLDGAQTGSAPIYGCRAWVNFDGTSVTNVGGEDRCAISGSGNVIKVVRTGTGNYTVTFTTAMPDANYAASTGYNIASGVNCCRVVSRASTSCTVITNNGTGGATANSDSVSVAIFR